MSTAPLSYDSSYLSFFLSLSLTSQALSFFRTNRSCARCHGWLPPQASPLISSSTGSREPPASSQPGPAGHRPSPSSLSFSPAISLLPSLIPLSRSFSLLYKGTNRARPQELTPRIPSSSPDPAQPWPFRTSTPSANAIPDRFLDAAEFQKRSECEDSFDYVGSSASRIRSSFKRDLRYR